MTYKMKHNSKVYLQLNIIAVILCTRMLADDYSKFLQLLQLLVYSIAEAPKHFKTTFS